MFRAHTSRPIASVVIIALALLHTIAAACDNLPIQTCKDPGAEFQKAAIEYNAETALVWDGTPFLVHVSNSLPDAESLLQAIAVEAHAIHRRLGYAVIAAGEVRPLPDVTSDDGLHRLLARRELVPLTHLEVRCCTDFYEYTLGSAHLSAGVVLLPSTSCAGGCTIDYRSKGQIILMHELYHLLGFSHPGTGIGVEMSDALNHPRDLLWLGKDERGNHQAIYVETGSRAQDQDRDRLACIFSHPLRP